MEQKKQKHIVCYSGGHSSALVAIEVVRKFGKENVILVNHECVLEPKDVERFEQEVAKYLELPITYVNFEGAETKDQFDVVMEKKSFVNVRSSAREALCTHVMKTEPFLKWLKELDSEYEYIVYYGFDKNELSRIQRRSTIMAAIGYKTDYPLALWLDRTIENTEDIGIPRPNSYNVYKHANCVGCLKAGWQHWYCVYLLDYPLFEKGMRSEELIGYKIHKDYYLSEKIELFEKMKKIGIEPNEHIQSQTFWKNVRNAIKEYDNSNIEITEEDQKPCECFI
jgi:hypothetical protein